MSGYVLVPRKLLDQVADFIDHNGPDEVRPYAKELLAAMNQLLPEQPGRSSPVIEAAQRAADEWVKEPAAGDTGSVFMVAMDVLCEKLAEAEGFYDQFKQGQASE